MPLPQLGRSQDRTASLSNPLEHSLAEYEKVAQHGINQHLLGLRLMMHLE